LKKSTQPAQNIKSQVEWCTTKTERQKKRREAQQSSRQLRRSRKMADVENGIHDSLVATAEPDEEAKRRCSQRILGVVVLLLGVVAAVELSVSLYIGIKDSNMAVLALAFFQVIFDLVVGYQFYLIQHVLWKRVCEIWRPEDELQIDA
jgi:hypothetical protein